MLIDRVGDAWPMGHSAPPDRVMTRPHSKGNFIGVLFELLNVSKLAVAVSSPVDDPF